MLTWLSGRELALRVRGLGLNPVGYTLYFLFFYFTWNANRPSRRAGLSASAELLVLNTHGTYGITQRELAMNTRWTLLSTFRPTSLSTRTMLTPS